MPVACERSSAAGRSEWFKVVLLACLGVAADERSQSGAQLLPVWHPVSGVCSRRFAPGLIEANHAWQASGYPLPICSRRFAPGLIEASTRAPAPARWASRCSRRFAPGLIEASRRQYTFHDRSHSAPGASRRASLKRERVRAAPRRTTGCSRRSARRGPLIEAIRRDDNPGMADSPGGSASGPD